MILRTYGRRHREGVPLSYDGPIIELGGSDGEDEDLGLGKDSVFGQEHFSQEPLFSSRGSATRFESMSGDGGFGGGRERKKKRVNWGREGVMVTLMETQESGEMMESVDEVNFVLDGLRTGQQVRVRHASLGSLLGICGSSQQRRLLRANGMVRTITDALLSLSLDNLPSNLAAVTLLYLLTSDGQDDQLLESPRCIRFLIRMLKPVTSVSIENKASKFGFKLLALHKDQNMSRGSSDKLDSSSAELMSKVREVLLDSKELKEVLSNEYGMDIPDLSPKWIALMTIEKACLTNLALDESSGIVRKTGGNFKEKLCEFGGLDAVFEVSMHCYTVLEGWEERSSSRVRDDKCLSSMVVLLKCLRIMENATFMSKKNQIHLLEMRRRQDSKGVSMSFTKLIVNLIKILSGLYLLKSIPPGCGNDKAKSYEGPNDPFEFSSISDREDSCDDSVRRAVEQCCSLVSKPFKKSAELSRDSQCRLDVCSRYVSSSSEMVTSYRDGVCSSKTRFGSSSSMNSQGEPSKHTNGICSMSTTSCLDNPVSNGNKRTVSMDLMLDSDGSQDPFAFDGDEFQPSKWDLLYGKKKPRKSKSRRLAIRNADDVFQLKPRRTQDSDKKEYHRQELENGNTRQSQEASTSGSISEGDVIPVTDCFLSGVKVLMNLTNDNPLGCKQIAACEGLETMASLIASHFPVFCSYARRALESREKNPFVALSFQSDKDLSDQELDLLVAILGLLVNLVEKDGSNRARLAKAKVRRHDLEGLNDESSMDVIPLLCSIFMASRCSVETAKDEKALTWDDEDAMLQGEKEAEKMILEAYSALLLAFLSTESKLVRDGIAAYLPQGKLSALVPVLERFVAFHISLDMMTPETHKTVSEVIESCRGP